MFTKIRSMVVLIEATLLLGGCQAPRNPSDPPAEPQTLAEPQPPPAPTPSNRPIRVEDDPVYQSYLAERRKTHPTAQWQDSPLTKWADALQNYEPRVKPGNQHALNTARRPFGVYLVRMHNRLHPIFTDEFLAWLDTLPTSDPRNQPQLAVRIEFATSGTDGRVVRIGVVRSSGVPSFDAAALDAVNQAAPFGPPPADLLSSDGNVYFHWEFHRDPVFACSTINARPYLISVN
jgi:TonB family protein